MAEISHSSVKNIPINTFKIPCTKYVFVHSTAKPQVSSTACVSFSYIF